MAFYHYNFQNKFYLYLTWRYFIDPYGKVSYDLTWSHWDEIIWDELLEHEISSGWSSHKPSDSHMISSDLFADSHLRYLMILIWEFWWFSFKYFDDSHLIYLMISSEFLRWFRDEIKLMEKKLTTLNSSIQKCISLHN